MYSESGYHQSGHANTLNIHQFKVKSLQEATFFHLPELEADWGRENLMAMTPRPPSDGSWSVVPEEEFRNHCQR